jgi:hypothetical protein
LNPILLPAATVAAVCRRLIAGSNRLAAGTNAMKAFTFNNPGNVTQEQLNPKDGWRFLTVEEVNERSQDPPSEPSKEIECWSERARAWTARAFGNDLMVTYRVKWPLPAEAPAHAAHESPKPILPRWIPFTEREPEQSDFPIFVCREGTTSYLRLSKLSNYMPSAGWTHWTHDQTPPIPVREQTQEEKDEAAMLRSMPGTRSLNSERWYQLGWNDGLRYARGN